MPARLSSMELSDPDATTTVAADPAATQDNRRKSGRVVRKPDLFSEDNFSGSLSQSASAKRKRAPRIINLADDEDEQLSDDESEEESEGEADEEELKESRRRSKQKKPAAKKQKVVNGEGPALTIRQAKPKSRPTKKVTAKAPRVRKSQAGDANGIYAKIFSQAQNTDDVIEAWLRDYAENSVSAVCDMVNFILKCTGADLTVDVHDIGDVDNVTGRLGDLQDEYQALKIAEYPLNSRAKQYIGFRDSLIKFFDVLIQNLHATDTLYADSALIENIQTWVSTMSSASIRPFRHTATVISMAMMNGLCDIAVQLQTLQSNTEQQIEKEKKAKRVNKDRVASMTEKVQDYTKRLEAIDNTLRDYFDTVFVHRYRDVEPKVRIECVSGLGYWISTYQSMFFEGQYLRYLGWLLSDTVASVRTEVVKQLRHLYSLRNSASRLRAFTDRFRPRMVEMASQDADPLVRASSVEMLDRVRDLELLEPDDIDTIGRLVFDSEPRVRKAVAKFFVSNINDVYEANLEEQLSGERVEDYLPNNDEADFESPKAAWIKLSCLASVLSQYDWGDGEEEQTRIEHGPPGSRDILVAAGLDSRFSLAAQAIYPHMTELQHWEWLAGYLIFDHSTIPEAVEGDVESQLQSLYKLEDGQEIILLEVLVSAVKLRLLQVADTEKEKKVKKSKGRRVDELETPETIARNLTKILPRLLSKFGAVPSAASAVLRLEHLLNLDIVEELQQDAAGYSSLLDKINEQFLGHSDDNVLAEASAALLRAKAHEELEEVTEDKLGELWTDTLSSLHTLTKDITDLRTARCPLPHDILVELVSTVSRICSLTSISDPTEELSKSLVPSKSKSRNSTTKLSALDVLLALGSRAGEVAVVDDQGDLMLESALAINSIKALNFQLMWSVHAVQALLSSQTEATTTDQAASFLADFSAQFSTILSTALQSNPGVVSTVRFVAATTLLDQHTLLATLRRTKTPKDASRENVDAIIDLLVKEISSEDQSLIIAAFVAAETQYAKKSGRSLEPDEDDPPEDLGAPEDEDEENEDGDEATILLAEQALCELTGKIVLAILARVIDSSGPRKGKLRQRIQRNKSKLGHNYKEVLNYLEDPSEKKQAKAKAKARNKEQQQKKREAEKEKEKKSEMVVVEEEEEDDNDGDEDENEDENEDEDEDEDAVGGRRDDEDEEELRRQGLVVVDEGEEEEEPGGGGGGDGEAEDEDGQSNVNGDEDDDNDDNEVMGD